MRVHALTRILLPLAVLVASPVAAAPADDLQRLLDDHWAWVLARNPVLARSLGEPAGPGLGDLSLAAADAEAAQAQTFLDRLKAIPIDGLTQEDRTSHRLLARQLGETVEGNRFPQRTMLFTTYAGWHQEAAGLADQLPFRVKADYADYLDRLADYPRLNDQALAVSDEAIRQGEVLPCAVLNGMEASIGGVLTDDPAASRFYKPFQATRPVDASEAEWAALQARAKGVIRDQIAPAYAKHLAWYRTRYQPACRQTVGVSELPGGRDYYAFRVRQMTTTDRTPDQIHQLGLSEVARIRAAMESVAAQAGFPSRGAMIQAMRTDPKYYPKSAEELMEAAATQAKTIDGLMPKFFGRLPRLPYGVKEIPAETAGGTTTAYYSPGNPSAGIAGFYYVNTSKLDQRPLWELPALTAHEAVPGHHNQIALQQELDLPPFRRFGGLITAFVEGWGLYAETIGEAMGLYDTPEKTMGRLSYEMWRATRLVVDTGIHSKGWTKERAVAFMTDNTALTPANIDAEVNRYISWPGQALAYKVGELKIRQLRARAETALGDRFRLPAFHDAVLGQGAVPLDVLEEQVDRWIAEQRAAAG